MALKTWITWSKRKEWTLKTGLHITGSTGATFSSPPQADRISKKCSLNASVRLLSPERICCASTILAAFHLITCWVLEVMSGGDLSDSCLLLQTLSLTDASVIQAGKQNWSGVLLNLEICFSTQFFLHQDQPKHCPNFNIFTLKNKIIYTVYTVWNVKGLITHQR